MLEIVTTADRSFRLPLAVMFASLTRTMRADSLRVTVLTDSLEASDVVAIAGDLETQCVHVPPNLVAGAHLPGYLKAPTLYRLLLGDLMPGNVDRVIYVDADTIIRRDITDLWEENLAGHSTAAVMDPVIPWAACPDGLPWQELSLPPDAAYFNAGMMVIDLGRWRRERIGQKALAFLRTHRLPHADQGGLNAALSGQWKRLEPSWNLQAGHLLTARSLTHVVETPEALDEARRTPAIVHFNNSPFGRPWEGGCVHPFKDEWLSRVDETPLCGWRPPAHAPRVPFLVRLRRAAALVIKG
ncbi:MAG: glycosyltransferase family 8 protein [Planctomycetia bacterium]